jgi:hypothetical protein
MSVQLILLFDDKSNECTENYIFHLIHMLPLIQFYEKKMLPSSQN